MTNTVYSVYIINKSGGLIYQKEHLIHENEVERTFKYPLGIQFKEMNERLMVAFGEKDGVKVGHSLIAINGEVLIGRSLPNGAKASDILSDETKYPLTLRFSKPKLSTNEKIVLASMFHSLFAIACKLSPAEKSSGIELIETNSFKLHCFQTITGVKLLVLTDTRVSNMDNFLKKLYELYGDFALKNPFYSLEMPIRCDAFDTNLQKLLEITEKSISLNLSNS